MSEWKTWKPEYDGHAPDDWEASMEWDCPAYNNGAFVKDSFSSAPQWWEGEAYRYRPAQDATPDLLAQCLALPQADREALIEALQKPRRDWADDVWEDAYQKWLETDERFVSDGDDGDTEAAAVIRSMCRPKEVELPDAVVSRYAGRLKLILHGDHATLLREFFKEATND